MPAVGRLPGSGSAPPLVLVEVELLLLLVLAPLLLVLVLVLAPLLPVLVLVLVLVLLLELELPPVAVPGCAEQPANTRKTEISMNNGNRLMTTSPSEYKAYSAFCSEYRV
jgi:hypothetical protein